LADGERTMEAASGKDRKAERTREAGVERLDLSSFAPLLALEHFHRYALAAQLATGRRVLDLGAGAGYGARLMRRSGAKVTALDCDLAEVRSLGADAVAGRGESLPFASNSFDVVTCFEMIEHALDAGEILDEIGRVLRSDGFAVVSTPDRRLYTERWGQRNPYHLHELDYHEFRSALRSRFPSVVILGQSVWSGSWMAALDDHGHPPSTPSRQVRVLQIPPALKAATAGAPQAPWASPEDPDLPAPLFFVAVCGRQEGAGPRLVRALGGESILHDPRQMVLGHALAMGAAVVARDEEISHQDQNARALRAERDEAAKHARNLWRELEERTHQLQNLEMLTGEIRGRVGLLEKHSENLASLLESERERVASLEAHAGNLERALAENVRHGENLASLLESERERVASLEAHAGNLERALADNARQETERRRILAEQSHRLQALAQERQALVRELDMTSQALSQMRRSFSVRMLRRLRILA